MIQNRKQTIRVKEGRSRNSTVSFIRAVVELTAQIKLIRVFLRVKSISRTIQEINEGIYIKKYVH